MPKKETEVQEPQPIGGGLYTEGPSGRDIGKQPKETPAPAIEGEGLGANE